MRLRNQKNSRASLGLSTPAWRELLRLALKNGWQPMGSAQPELPPSDTLWAGSPAHEWAAHEWEAHEWEAHDWEAGWLWWEQFFHSDAPEAALAQAMLAQAILETYLPIPPEQQDAQTADSRLVLLEDALNLVDALDRAYQAYEPVKVPASYFLFEPDNPALALRPSLGALAATIEVCRQGSFSIEPWRSRF